MKKKEVLDLLEANKNERGLAHWKRLDPSQGKWRSYGMGLTQVKKLAKEVGRDHDLALELWKTPIYECKILATLIDEPKKVTVDQVERQVNETGYWLMSHTYCSCLMPKVPFIKEKAEEWMDCKDDVRRRSGYLLLYQIAKDDKKLGDDYFEPYLKIIEKKLPKEENFVKDGMNNALWMIGMRSKGLHAKALRIAKKIGKVSVDYGENSCEAVDVVKHLESDRIKKKLGLGKA